MTDQTAPPPQGPGVPTDTALRQRVADLERALGEVVRGAETWYVPGDLLDRLRALQVVRLCEHDGCPNFVHADDAEVVYCGRRDCAAERKGHHDAAAD